ncbi:hypothetical protein JHW43_005027 [Diplocarpon mali]|nr:hypothetical protein JHW43_005027 [Diplocarpon mali]
MESSSRCRRAATAPNAPPAFVYPPTPYATHRVGTPIPTPDFHASNLSRPEPHIWRKRPPTPTPTPTPTQQQQHEAIRGLQR